MAKSRCEKSNDKYDIMLYFSSSDIDVFVFTIFIFTYTQHLSLFPKRLLKNDSLSSVHSLNPIINLKQFQTTNLRIEFLDPDYLWLNFITKDVTNSMNQ